MSAYVNGHGHVDAILRVAFDGPRDHGPAYPGDGWEFGSYWHEGRAYDVRHEEAERLGALLVAENVASVQYRYRGEAVDTLPGPVDKAFCVDALAGRYAMAPKVPQLSAVEALKALDGYEYQSCEHPAWEHSEARAFVAALRGRLIGCLPGYDEAETWEVR